MLRLLSSRFSNDLPRWQSQFQGPALTVLLLGQVVSIFVLAPLFGAGLVPFTALNVMQVLLLLVSYLALPPGSKTRAFIFLCLVPTLWIACAGSNRPIAMGLHIITTFSITLSVAQAVFQAQRITRHQLLGAVVVYLNLALLFMHAYGVLDSALPHAFSTSGNGLMDPNNMLYFSLTTLTSTGYGDILPLHPLARSLANLEAVVGQLFLAILLARLVSLHMKFLISTSTK